MQTFLPYPNFALSASALDRMRLGKQRVECLQLYNALTQADYGWQNHPATNMWRGHEGALLMYAVYICREWLGRGYKDNMLPFFRTRILSYDSVNPPSWLGDEAFHLSHQSNLLRKVREAKDRAKTTKLPRHIKTAKYLNLFYSKFKWQAPDDLPYIWPNPHQS